MERTILITGASSGLGLAFLRHYASQTSTKIIALDLSPLPAEISTSFPNVRFSIADVSHEHSLYSCREHYQTKTTPIHLLIHSAGIRGLVPSVVKENPGDVAAAETYAVIDHATMTKTLEINTFGTFNIIKSFLPNLQLAAKESPESLPKVVVISSRMGSISANTAGGGYAYRASKAALNAVVKSFSIDVPEVAFLLLHPGRVETGLVEWKEEGAMSVEESLRDCLDVIGKVGREDSGRFLDRFGKEIMWWMGCEDIKPLDS